MTEKPRYIVFTRSINMSKLINSKSQKHPCYAKSTNLKLINHIDLLSPKYYLFPFKNFKCHISNIASCMCIANKFFKVVTTLNFYNWSFLQIFFLQLDFWQLIFLQLSKDSKNIFQVTSFSWSHDGRMALICYQVSCFFSFSSFFLFGFTICAV